MCYGSMSATIHQAFWNWADAYFGSDTDKIDCEALYDRTLTVAENIESFKAQFPRTPASQRQRERTGIKDALTSRDIMTDIKRQQQIREAAEKAARAALAETTLEWLPERGFKTIGIVGDRRTGKTAIGYGVAMELMAQKKMPVYFLQHPAPQVIQALGWINIRSSWQLDKLRDCVVMIDEPQLYFATGSEMRDFLEWVSIAAQRGIVIILMSSDTRWFVARVEAYIDAWIIKDCDARLVKRGSVVSQVIRDTTRRPEAFELTKEEYLFYARRADDVNGLRTYTLPVWWTDAMSTPYAQAGARK